jgi:ribosomal protein S18 acetylase RimI-like enzyme
MSNALQILTFVPDDLVPLRHHLQSSWRDTYEPIFGAAVAREMAEPLSSATLADLVPQEDETALIARINGAIVGCAVIAERCDIAYIWGVYVATYWHRKDVGKALMRHATTLVSTATIVQVTVLSASEPAVSFYRALGFSVDEIARYDLTPSCSAEACVMNVPLAVLKNACGVSDEHPGQR